MCRVKGIRKKEIVKKKDFKGVHTNLYTKKKDEIQKRVHRLVLTSFFCIGTFDWSTIYTIVFGVTQED